LVQKYTRYQNTEDRSLEEFAAHILMIALPYSMLMSALRGLARFVSDSNKAYCYQLVHKWQRFKGIGELDEIFCYVERELRLTECFTFKGKHHLKERYFSRNQ
jgi:hypothetical protein